MVDLGTSSSKSEVSKSNSWKITPFSKTMALQRMPFLTMFYTINLSPLPVTKWGFMLIIILSNYQKCPVPLTGPWCETASELMLVSFINIFYWDSRDVHCSASCDGIWHSRPVTHESRWKTFLRWNFRSSAQFHKEIKIYYLNWDSQINMATLTTLINMTLSAM